MGAVPDLVARQAMRRHRHLCALPKPFSLRGSPMELLWSAALDDDAGCSFLRELIHEVVREVMGDGRVRKPRS